MHMKVFAGVLMIGALALSGCATRFSGSAPADPGHIYVVGGKVKPFMGWQPTVWRCPAESSGECQEISVTK